MAISATIGFPEGSTKPSVQLSIPADDFVTIAGGLAKVAAAMPIPELEEITSVISNLVPKL